MREVNKMRKIKIVCKNDNVSSVVRERLIKYLKNDDFEITEIDPEIVISIGGDGTFITSLKENNYSEDAYYVGVNSGTLGFLQEVEIDDLEYFVKCLKDNKLIFEEVSLQETRVVMKNNKVIRFRSFNEIVIRDPNLQVIKLNVVIEGFKLECFIGDGLLISTSTGSTAYNMSLGGSIVHPNLHTLQITPVAPLNSKAYRTLNNSVIVPENMSIKIVPCLADVNVMISIDGENKLFNNVKYIETKSCDKKLTLLKFANYNYWEKIESKFLK
jgi:NAD+ kinase